MLEGLNGSYHTSCLCDLFHLLWRPYSFHLSPMCLPYVFKSIVHLLFVSFVPGVTVFAPRVSCNPTCVPRALSWFVPCLVYVFLFSFSWLYHSLPLSLVLPYLPFVAPSICPCVLRLRENTTEISFPLREKVKQEESSTLWHFSHVGSICSASTFPCSTKKKKRDRKLSGSHLRPANSLSLSLTPTISVSLAQREDDHRNNVAWLYPLQTVIIETEGYRVDL